MVHKDQRKMKEYEGKREIGENFAVSQEEKEEDLLERLYLWRQEGRPLWPAELCVHMKITRRELNQLMRQMVRYGYLEEPEERRELEMTPLGRARGAECLARHQRLTQLIQMVCDLDEEQAEENACGQPECYSGDRAVSAVRGYSRPDSEKYRSQYAV